MFTLALKIDAELVIEYDFGSEAEARTVVGKLIALSRSSWDYDGGTKTWTSGLRTMQITEEQP